MKERIETKLQENLERILAKEELDRFDVAILKDELLKIKTEEFEKETKEKQALEEAKRKERLDTMTDLLKEGF